MIPTQALLEHIANWWFFFGPLIGFIAGAAIVGLTIAVTERFGGRE